MDRQPASEIESSSATTSDSTKAKYRPQQSCIKCRERKVKCDRAKPCRACCSRGLQSECEYNTNNEDRFQINQADIIENLRREVNRLKRRLACGAVNKSPQRLGDWRKRNVAEKGVKEDSGDNQVPCCVCAI
ncbi:hypothetical protein VTN96DRAFT_5125 [Rasamsonia emersonii]